MGEPTAKSVARRLMKAIAGMAERDRLMNNRHVGYWSDRRLDIEAQSKCLRGVVRVRWYTAHGDVSSKAEMERWLIQSTEDRHFVDVCGEPAVQRNGDKVREYEGIAEHLESVLRKPNFGATGAKDGA